MLKKNYINQIFFHNVIFSIWTKKCIPTKLYFNFIAKKYVSLYGNKQKR